MSEANETPGQPENIARSLKATHNGGAIVARLQRAGISPYLTWGSAEAASPQAAKQKCLAEGLATGGNRSEHRNVRKPPSKCIYFNIYDLKVAPMGLAPTQCGQACLTGRLIPLLSEEAVPPTLFRPLKRASVFMGPSTVRQA
jgi:hypothetical protein